MEDICYAHLCNQSCPLTDLTCPNAHHFAQLTNLSKWVFFDAPDLEMLDFLAYKHCSHPAFKCYKFETGPVIRLASSEEALAVVEEYQQYYNPQLLTPDHKTRLISNEPPTNATVGRLKEACTQTQSSHSNALQRVKHSHDSLDSYSSESASEAIETESRYGGVVQWLHSTQPGQRASPLLRRPPPPALIQPPYPQPSTLTSPATIQSPAASSIPPSFISSTGPSFTSTLPPQPPATPLSPLQFLSPPTSPFTFSPLIPFPPFPIAFAAPSAIPIPAPQRQYTFPTSPLPQPVTPQPKTTTFHGKDKPSNGLRRVSQPESITEKVLAILRENMTIPSPNGPYQTGWKALQQIWNVTQQDFRDWVLRRLSIKPAFQQEQILLSLAAANLANVKNLSSYLFFVMQQHETSNQVCFHFLAGACPNSGCHYEHPANSPGWDALLSKWNITFRDFDYAVLNYLSKKPPRQQDEILVSFAKTNLKSVVNLSAYLSNQIHLYEAATTSVGKRQTYPATAPLSHHQNPVSGQGELLDNKAHLKASAKRNLAKTAFHDGTMVGRKSSGGKTM